MLKGLNDYFLVKKSGLFDPRYYLARYPDIRKSDVDPLLHYLRHGWKEGRYPSLEWETKMTSGDYTLESTSKNNPFVEYINKMWEEKKASRPNILKILMLLFRMGLSFWIQKGVVFIGGYPYPEREKDGYYQRIRSIDSLIKNKWRIYIDSVRLPGKDFWYDLPAPRTLVIRPNGIGVRPGFIQLWIRLCILRTRIIYFHSILFISGKEFFWENPKIKKIVDVHGAVPEEFKCQGDENSSAYFNQVEKVVVANANELIVVSEAMRSHLVNKYPGLIQAQFIILPNIPEIPFEQIDKPYVNEKAVIIYAGGLQAWQQIPKIIDAILRTYNHYVYKFYCPNPQEIIALLPINILDQQLIEVESKQREEIFLEYRVCHYGFILRDNTAVNHVACPTKLVEYLAMGVIPIVDCSDIGDFKTFGMQYINLDDLLKNKLPTESNRQKMAIQNYSVYNQVFNQYKSGVNDLLIFIKTRGVKKKMVKINKVPYYIKRFLDVWRTEGFRSSLRKSVSKVLIKLDLGVIQQVEYKIDRSEYQDIYDSYLSIGENKQNPEFIEFPSYDLSEENLAVKTIAFYLPQYHPIPENNTWWGTGFTEWTNVSKSVPNFVGHYQPHLPGELGFYDLRIPEVQQRQVELAKKFGIYGYCFYYYWFDGKRLLDLPLEQFVKNSTIDFPFCLCWANENWTRTWDGLDNEVLIAQNHSAESDIAFIKDITPYLTNDRYIKIDGRPLLIIYRPQLLPDSSRTVNRWREYCKEIGLGDLFLIAIQSAGIIDPRKMGFDAAAEFPPHGIPIIPLINGQLKITNTNFKGMVFDYQQVADQFINKTKPDYQLFRTVITCWDNTARRQDEPLIFHNSSPQIYQSWLSAVIKYTYENSPIGERFVFINAWNEWAEATHLEPDRKYGYAYLDATAQALKALINDTQKYQTESISTANLVKRHDTAVILHLFYPELWEETRSYLDNLDNNFDLYVSIPEGVNFNHELILNNYPFAYIYQCPNRGRDIAPFIQLLSIVDKLGYEYVCKIHTKKSVHREDGTLWRTEILNELLGSAEQISDIKRHLHHKDIGIIGPKNHILSTQYFMGGNETLIDNLSKKLSVQYNGDYFTFIAGSMFWFKPGAIATILNLNLSEEDFPDEFGQKDGTLAHAMERVIGLVAQKNGYKVVQTGTFTDTPNDDYNFATPFKG